jgi:hypothetical protein
MSNELQPEYFPQMARPPAKPNKPLPFEEFWDYGDYPPDFMELEDVEHIWWGLASRMSKYELRRRLKKVIDQYHHSGCFWFAAVADLQYRGRYPRGVIRVLRQVLKPRKLMPLSPDEGVILIQADVWHICIYKALEWCPAEALPRHLRAKKLEVDLGV